MKTDARDTVVPQVIICLFIMDDQHIRVKGRIIVLG